MTEAIQRVRAVWERPSDEVRTQGSLKLGHGQLEDVSTLWSDLNGVKKRVSPQMLTVYGVQFFLAKVYTG